MSRVPQILHFVMGDQILLSDAMLIQIMQMIFTFAEEAISQVLKLQSIVVTSTVEVEYVATTQAIKEAIWLQMLVEEFEYKQEKIALLCNGQSALHLAKNQTFYQKKKHIRVQSLCSKKGRRKYCGYTENPYRGQLSRYVNKANQH